MKISTKIEKMVCDQINGEIYSAYLYLSMSAYFTENNLKGFAHWLFVQAQEELTHAMKYYKFLLDRRGHITFPAIGSVKDDWKSPLEIFEFSYEHEQSVTARISKFADFAIEEKDHATLSMLNWFINEQVEEEANFSEVIQKLVMASESKEALLFVDKELSGRIFVDKTITTTN